MEFPLGVLNSGYCVCTENLYMVVCKCIWAQFCHVLMSYMFRILFFESFMFFTFQIKQRKRSKERKKRKEKRQNKRKIICKLKTSNSNI